jgi:hypothetical protein
MLDPKESSDPQESPESRETSEQKKGGFGAFAQKYRDRWAADHPHAGEAKQSGDQPEPSTQTDASVGELDRQGQS